MITISVTERGNITLPVKLRKAAGIKANDLLSVEFVDGGIMLRPVMAIPIEIYSDERLAEFEKVEQEVGELMRARGIKF